MRAPERLYAGAESTYEIHLQNPGDAEARHVKLAASLPADAVFVSCTRDGKFDSKRNRIVWSLDDLSPGADQTVQVTCSMQAAGQNRLEVTAIADGDLKRSQFAVTEVIAVADLVLDVSDPSGPVAVGHDAVYELRVRNRGTKSAEGVEIVAFYSKGVEPVSAEGALTRFLQAPSCSTRSPRSAQARRRYSRFMPEPRPAARIVSASSYNASRSIPS